MLWTTSSRPDVKLGTVALFFVFWLWLVNFANENASIMCLMKKEEFCMPNIQSGVRSFSTFGIR